MNLIILGTALIMFGVGLLGTGIVSELSKCVQPKEGQVGVTFQKSNFDTHEAGFMHGFKADNGREFSAWGLYKKEAKK